jgi:hypothetical protein
MSNHRIKGNGYAIATLYNDNGRRYFGIHQLVALVYLNNPHNLPCVGHKDNIRTHNHYKNLYWCTNKENSQQMVRDGRHYIPPNILSPGIEDKLVEDYLGGVSIKDIETTYKVSHGVIYGALKRRGIHSRRNHRKTLKL